MAEREISTGGLPTYLTRFVGRRDELADLADLVRRGARVITLCGVGGSGKTRLAVETTRALAEDRSLGFEHVGWVPLAGVVDPADVAWSAAAALSLRDEPLQPADALAGWLGAQPALLVLDNCEVVAGAVVDLVTGLLRACPGLVVMMTSRIALHHDDGQVFVVPPLSTKVPTDGPGLADAATLFVDRARIMAPAYQLSADNLALIGQICA